MNNIKASQAVKRALAKYGETTCREAFYMNSKIGEGSNTISHTLKGLKTTRAADAAINAGRWLTVNEISL